MFDERSEKWIVIFKWIIVISFFGDILLGIAAGACFSNDVFRLGLRNTFPIFFLCVILGCFTAAVHLVLNMLFIQLLSNVQAIREALEAMPVPPKHRREPAAPDRPQWTSSAPASEAAPEEAPEPEPEIPVPPEVKTDYERYGFNGTCSLCGRTGRPVATCRYSDETGPRVRPLCVYCKIRTDAQMIK